MDNEARMKAFAGRFTQALQSSGYADLSDGDLVKLLARHKVQVTSQTVGYWRNGRHMPKLSQYEGIAKLLGMTPGELAFGAVRVGDTRARYLTDDPAERALLEAYALLDAPERAAISALLHALSLRATRQEKRPGPRKQR